MPRTSPATQVRYDDGSRYVDAPICDPSEVTEHSRNRKLGHGMFEKPEVGSWNVREPRSAPPEKPGRGALINGLANGKAASSPRKAKKGDRIIPRKCEIRGGINPVKNPGRV